VTKYHVKLEPPDWDDEDLDPYDDLPRQRSNKILPEFRSKNLSAKEKEHGIPEVKLVAFDRVPHMPKWSDESDEYDDENLEELDGEFYSDEEAEGEDEEDETLSSDDGTPPAH
jgi:hypothetical protein